MSNQSLERLFRRYRRKGCPKALGRVFDATAPHLLRVAGHLAGNRVDAEDLLQETFLGAIEKADGWREDQPLLPWLFGILANMARRARRRGLRSPDPDRLPSPIQPAPSELTTRSEFRQAVDRALGTLAEPYRNVLLLHLGEGLEPTGVATRLGRPPSTVRTQIKRGLARLRKNLPVGLAPAVLTFPRESLVEIRRTVCARAAAKTGATGAAKGGSVSLHILSHPAFITVSLVVGITTGLLIGFDDQDPTGMGRAGSGDSLAAAPDPHGAAPGRPGQDPPKRAALPVIKEAEGGTPGLPPHASLLVQVVDAATGRPLPGAEVAWWNRDLAAAGLLPWSRLSGSFGLDRFLESPAVLGSNLEEYLGAYGRVLRADDRGLVRVPLVCPLGLRLRGRSGSRLGQATVHEPADHLDGGVPYRFALQPTLTVRVKLVSGDGRPRVGVPLAVVAGRDRLLWFGASRGPAGTARVTLLPASWMRREKVRQVTLLPAVLGGCEGVPIDLRQPPTGVLTLQVPPTAPLTVRVTDHHGRPFTGRAAVRLDRDGGPGPEPLLTYLVGETDEGRLTFPHVALGCRFECEANRKPSPYGYTDPVVCTGPTHPGRGATVAVQVPALPPPVRGRVLSAAGRPCAGRLLHIAEGYPCGLVRTDAEGRFTWRPDAENVPQRLRLTLWEGTDAEGHPRGATGSVALPRPLPPDGADVGRIVLAAPGRLLAGLVVDGRGRPVAGARVWARPEPARAGAWSEASVSDSRGRFVLRGAGAGELRVSTRKSGWYAAGPTVCDAGTDNLRLVLRRTGGMRLKLVHAPRLDATWLRFELARERGEGVCPAPDRSGLIADLHPGLYRLVVKAGGMAVARLDGIRVRPGQVTEDPRLRLDLGRRVKGILLRLGLPGGETPAAIRVEALDGQGERAYVAGCRRVEAGTWLVCVRTETRRIRVQAGACRPLELDARDLEAPVCPAPGLPVRIAVSGVPQGYRVRPGLRAVGHEGQVSTPRYEDGSWRLAVSAPGRYRVTWGVVKTADGAVSKGYLDPGKGGRITVSEGTGEKTFRFSLDASELEAALVR